MDIIKQILKLFNDETYGTGLKVLVPALIPVLIPIIVPYIKKTLILWFKVLIQNTERTDIIETKIEKENINNKELELEIIIALGSVPYIFIFSFISIRFNLWNNKMVMYTLSFISALLCCYIVVTLINIRIKMFIIQNKILIYGNILKIIFVQYFVIFEYISIYCISSWNNEEKIYNVMCEIKYYVIGITVGILIASKVSIVQCIVNTKIRTEVTRRVFSLSNGQSIQVKSHKDKYREHVNKNVKISRMNGETITLYKSHIVKYEDTWGNPTAVIPFRLAESMIYHWNKITTKIGQRDCYSIYYIDDSIYTKNDYKDIKDNTVNTNDNKKRLIFADSKHKYPKENKAINIIIVSLNSNKALLGKLEAYGSYKDILPPEKYYNIKEIKNYKSIDDELEWYAFSHITLL